MVTANGYELTIFGLKFQCPNHQAFDPVSNTTQFLSWRNQCVNISKECKLCKHY